MITIFILLAGLARGEVSGDLKQWHRVTLSFDAPVADDANPFLDRRLNVTFARGGLGFVVPGFYAGEGRWRARFSPPETGTWTYIASFRAGPGVAVSLDPAAGEPAGFDGASGSFEVAESDASGRDFRAPERGLLKNRGHHYLTFGGSGRPWIKSGPDIPENLLGYAGFVNTPKAIHRFEPHVKDWRPGDPDWDGGKGRGIIGAINYIASRGANCVYFLPMNLGGDYLDVFPTVAEEEKTRYDVAKLEQWEIVFAHAQSKGVFLHFQLAETEEGNETYHDGGELGPERKLFYREMIARFAHHPGVEWNLGEENDYGTVKRKAFAAHLKALDPYDHPVTTHIHTNQYEKFYGPLLGDGNFDMTSFQSRDSGQKLVDVVQMWRRRSAEADAPLVVSIDEPQKIECDPKDERRGFPHGRRDKMWPAYLAGAGGFEWYVQKDGGGHGLDPLLEDFRRLEAALDWSGHAVRFLERLPLLEMRPANGLVSDGWCLAQPGKVYAIYLPQGGPVKMKLGEGEYTLTWFDPRTGKEHEGKLGEGPPSEGDWAALVRLAPGR